MTRLDARVTKLEAQSQTDDLPGEGLAALLAYASRHPPAEAGDPDDDRDGEAYRDGLTLLLHEARQWKEDNA